MTNALSTRSVSDDIFTVGFTPTLLEQIESSHREIARDAFALFRDRDGQEGSPMEDWLRAEAKLLAPVSVSVSENKGQIQVTADVSGFALKDLRVFADGQQLKIWGESGTSAKTNGAEKKGSRRICCDVFLPAQVRAEAASATLDKGVLKLELPKAVPAKEIPVKAA